jgi:hypothetical protein
MAPEPHHSTALLHYATRPERGAIARREKKIVDALARYRTLR